MHLTPRTPTAPACSSDTTTRSWGRRRTATTATILATCVLAVAGCGGGGGGSGTTTAGSGDTATGGGAATLTHVDGKLALSGDQLTVTPSNGGAKLVLPLGPEVQRGQLQALVASGARGRVYYTGGDSPTAARVDAAPTAEDGAQTYDGKITKVSTTSITIDGADGARTFSIRAADAAAFDVAHLKEHRSEGSPVRIYYRSEGGEHAVAYEDA